MEIIAHRGYSKHYPQNTLLAFKKALEAGVDRIETDLRLSRDKIAIIFHDANLKKITGLNEAPENLTLSELQKLDVGNGEYIPTLDELLLLTSAQAELILEIKYKLSTYKELCEIIEKKIRDKIEWVEVSCFEDKVIEYMYKLNPQIKLHKLIDKAATLEDKGFENRYDYVSYLDINIKLKEIALAKGLLQKFKVIFWTVNKEDISKEKEAGLYGIMKNDPSV